MSVSAALQTRAMGVAETRNEVREKARRASEGYRRDERRGYRARTAVPDGQYVRAGLARWLGGAERSG